MNLAQQKRGSRAIWPVCAWTARCSQSGMTQNPSRTAPTSQAGFTLVEVLVALVVLCAGTAATAHVAVATARDVHLARLESAAVSAALGKIEQLNALTWSLDASAPPGGRADSTSDLSPESPGGGGTGLSLSPSGTLESNVAGFVDHVDRLGRWVGRDRTPPGTAFLTRRWNVRPVAGASDAVIALQVFVTPAFAPASPQLAGRVREAGHVLLTTVRVRKAL